MTPLLLLVLVIAIAAVISKTSKDRGSSDTPWPFYAKKPLSNPEQVLYFRLCRALPEQIVLAQVALSRMLGVTKGNNFGEWFNRINRMSADFVLCSKDSTIIAVIELDDASHKKANRETADAKKDKALRSAGIRILRWQVNAMPNETEIRTLFPLAHQSPQNTTQQKGVPPSNSVV
jgi:very-short-patch-repair endonuclease